MDPQLAKAKLDIQERLQILPEELVDLITDGTLDVVTFNLQQKYTLTDTQRTLLENEIILVLTLFLSPDTFVQNVQESLEIKTETAEAIGVEVTDQIFDLVADIIETVESGRKDWALGKSTEETLKTLEKKESINKLIGSLSKPATSPLETNLEESIVPIRTMEGDISRIHGYGAYYETLEEQSKLKDTDSVSSSQETILKKDSQ